MKRTIQQNKALHLYCIHLSEKLNEAGLDQRTVLKPSIEIPWTPEAVKEQLWKPIQKALYSKTSTTELDTPEVSHVYETLNRFMGEKHGVYTPFPSIEHDPVTRTITGIH